MESKDEDSVNKVEDMKLILLIVLQILLTLVRLLMVF